MSLNASNKTWYSFWEPIYIYTVLHSTWHLKILNETLTSALSCSQQDLRVCSALSENCTHHTQQWTKFHSLNKVIELFSLHVWLVMSALFIPAGFWSYDVLFVAVEMGKFRLVCGKNKQTDTVRRNWDFELSRLTVMRENEILKQFKENHGSSLFWMF